MQSSTFFEGTQAPPSAIAINGSTFTYGACFLLYFSHWIGVQISAVIFLALMYVALLTKLHSGRFRRDFLYIGYFVCTYVFLVALIQTPSLAELVEWSSVGTPRLLFQAIGLFLVFAFISLLTPLPEDKLHRFLRLSYNLFALTIGVEWFLVNVAGIPNSVMPAFKDSHSYYLAYEGYCRPFGLTGNASVNGSILVMALWILVSSGATRFANRYIILTAFILYLNNSGQAYLAYALSVIYYYLREVKGLKRYILAFTLFGGAGYIVYSGVISKVSYSYMLTVFQFMGFENITFMDRLSQIMGGYGKYSQLFTDLTYTTEFYPVYSLSRFGILLSIATWLYIFFRLPKKNKGLIFLATFIGSIHYPTILFVETQVLLGAYIFLTSGTKAKALAQCRVAT